MEHAVAVEEVVRTARKILRVGAVADVGTAARQGGIRPLMMGHGVGGSAETGAKLSERMLRGSRRVGRDVDQRSCLSYRLKRYRRWRPVRLG